MRKIEMKLPPGIKKNTSEEKVSEFKDIAIANNQNEEKGEKRLEK